MKQQGKPRSKNMAVMFIDVQGFTSRTSASRRAETAAFISDLEDLCVAEVENYRGKIVKSTGDGFLLTFESSTDAVHCGMALQNKAIQRLSKNQPNSYQIRVVINTGEVLLRNNDIFGEAVNIAARLEEFAEVKEVYFTEATYLSMNKAEVPSCEIGYRHLKGIPDEIKVYKVVREKYEFSDEQGSSFQPQAIAEGKDIRRPTLLKRLVSISIDLLLVLALTILIDPLIPTPASPGTTRPDKENSSRFQLASQRSDRLAKWRPKALKFLQESRSREPIPDRVQAPPSRETGPYRKSFIAFLAIFITYTSASLLALQGTLGMQIMKLKLERSDGGKLMWWQKILRPILWLVATIPLLGLGHLPALIRKDGRGLPDLCLNTKIK